MASKLQIVFRDTADDAGPLLDDVSKNMGAVAEDGAGIAERNAAAQVATDAESAGALQAAGDLTRAADSSSSRISDILGGDEEPSVEQAPYTGARRLTPEEEDAQEAARAEAAYERIRSASGDTQRIAENTGIDENVLNRVKSHLFDEEHELPMGPNTVVTQRFVPSTSISDLWEKADAGTLTDTEREQFQALMQHESVESSLMAQGLPYRSADPAAYDEWGTNWPSAAHYGAHDISPHSAYADNPWRGFSSMGFGDPPTTPFARDLSNVDDVVAELRQRVGI